jgi:hypothetical protein
MATVLSKYQINIGWLWENRQKEITIRPIKKPPSAEKWGDLDSSILLPPYRCGGEIERQVICLFWL